MAEITEALLVANAVGKAPDTAIPQFFMKDVKNNFKSNQEGRPVYDTKEYVRIIIPGDRNSIPERPVKDVDKARWPKQYAMFAQGLEMATDGTPLEQWPPIDRNQVEFLKHWNVRTVEQLSQVNDVNVQRMGMGMMSLRANAALWLEQARSGAGISRVVQERDELKSQVTLLTEQLADLASRMSEMAARQDGGVPAPAPNADLMQAMMEKMAALEARVSAPIAEPVKRTRRTRAEMEAARAAGEA